MNDDQPTAEERARAGLRASVARNHGQMVLTEESRMLLAALLREEMHEAVRKGIEEAMPRAISAGIQHALTNQAAAQFATVFLDTVRLQASSKVDLWAGGLIRGTMTRLAAFAFAGSIVYAVGGWGALATLAKWLFGDTLGSGK